jgi:tyrosinase
VIFDNYGNPNSGNDDSGPILTSNPCYNTNAYDILVYDTDGYDQYGYDVYGNPRPQYPPPCPPPTDIYSDIPDVGFICNSSSEIRLENGRYRYIRKSASAMSLSDWQRFRSAWNNLVTDGEIGRLATMHSQAFNQHQSPRFLPWHREFTARLEDSLHRIDPCVFLPYWDVVSMPSFPQGIADTINPIFPPDVIHLNSNGQVVATVPVDVAIGINGLLPNAGLQNAILAQATYTTFAQGIESFHDQIHVHVGGSLMFVSTAPRHPVFYLLHANVDRLWHLWQLTHASQPTAAVINTLNPLQFGPGDSKTYAQESNINNVQTVRGGGYQYI